MIFTTLSPWPLPLETSQA
jgi:N-carbamoylputrescine amidase